MSLTSHSVHPSTRLPACLLCTPAGERYVSTRQYYKGEAKQRCAGIDPCFNKSLIFRSLHYYWASGNDSATLATPLFFSMVILVVRHWTLTKCCSVRERRIDSFRVGCDNFRGLIVSSFFCSCRCVCVFFSSILMQMLLFHHGMICCLRLPFTTNPFQQEWRF